MTDRDNSRNSIDVINYVISSMVCHVGTKLVLNVPRETLR